MPDPLLLPMADQPPVERADAARNREALLCAARRLVDNGRGVPNAAKRDDQSHAVHMD